MSSPQENLYDAIRIVKRKIIPGMVYYLACWFPARERGKVNSFFMLSIAVASVLAAPMIWLDHRAFEYPGL